MEAIFAGCTRVPEGRAIRLRTTLGSLWREIAAGDPAPLAQPRQGETMPMDNIITCRIDDYDLKKLDASAEEMCESRTQALRYLIRLPKEVRQIRDRENGVLVFDLGSIYMLTMQVRRHGCQFNQIGHELNSLELIQSVVHRWG